jgi:signal transduction histidine kinase
MSNAVSQVLATARRFRGGQISVESRRGHGSSFRFTLNRARL